MPNIGPMELIVVLAIALVVLGPKRLPDAGRSLGKGMRDFKDALSGGDRHDDDRELPAIAEERRRGLAPAAGAEAEAEVEREREREPVAR
jgi:sec-independent protein translocase protein TatA